MRLCLPQGSRRWSPPPAFLHPRRAQGPVLPPTCVCGGQEKLGSAPVLSPTLWEVQPARPPARGLRPPSPSALGLQAPALPAVESASPRREGKAAALSPSPSSGPKLGLLMAGVKGSLERNRGTGRTREPRSQKLRSCPKIQGQTFHLFLDEVTRCGNQKKKKSGQFSHTAQW